MTHAASSRAKRAPEPTDQTTESPGSPGAEPEGAEIARKTGTNGALFRALMDAGADAVVAYTADQGMHSAVVAAVGTQVQPILSELRQFAAAVEQRLDTLEQRLGGLEQRLGGLEQRMDTLEQRMDTLERRLADLVAEVRRDREIADAKFDLIRRELRLIWGALGVMVAVQLAILGTLLAK